MRSRSWKRRSGDAALILANKVDGRDLSKLSWPERGKLVVDFYRNVLRPAATSRLATSRPVQSCSTNGRKRWLA